MAGVPKSPSRDNLLGKPAIARDRKNPVLKRMAELKMISSYYNVIGKPLILWRALSLPASNRIKMFVIIIRGFSNRT